MTPWQLMKFSHGSILQFLQQQKLHHTYEKKAFKQNWTKYVYPYKTLFR